MKTNKLALNECFRSSCLNILILNVLFMVCGAMAGGGGGWGWGGVASCMAPMNDFPVIGHLVMRTGLWDRQGANIASRYKEMYSVELFLR